MRAIWILGGVVVGLSSVAGASPSLQFQTVLDSNSSIAGDLYGNASQVVVSPNGAVAINGVLQNSGNAAVIYSTLSGNTWNNQAIAVGGSQFNSFDNLAVSGVSPTPNNLLTFVATDTSDSNAGILQWNSSSPGLNQVAYEGDAKGFTSVGANGTDSGGGTLEMQVNSAGEVAFPGAKSSVSGIYEGDASSIPAHQIFNNTGTLTNAPDPGSRIGIGTDGSGAALLFSSGTPGIYTFPNIVPPAPLGAPIKVSGSFIPSNKADPLLGYLSTNTGNATLMLVNGSSGSLQNIVLAQNGAAPVSIISSQFTIPAGEVPEAQMNPIGQIALFVPSTTGDTIQHTTVNAGGAASVVASVAPSSGPVPATAVAIDPAATNLEIISLSSPGQTWGPEINSGGTILFQAEVGTSAADEKEALMLWSPGMASPEILLAAGDQVAVGGQPVTINDLLLNSLSNDYDYFKNALNDQNQIAVAVDYTTQSNLSGSAVLFATVPEPSSVALISLAGLGLLKRRRTR